MADIKIRTSGVAGHITLSREQALNALSYDMSLAIEDALQKWRHDPDVALVVIDAEGERAFCAGGDLVKIYQDTKAGNARATIDFWRDEYQLNATIAEYEKPIVAFMHGFVMGGGVGIGGHSSHRIVCETSQIAMPECSIGLIPDVGGTHLLSRAPGHIGEYLGLTGARLNGADAIYTGFADHYVAFDLWAALKMELMVSGDVGILTAQSELPSDGILAAAQPAIDRCFSASDLSEIISRLGTESEPLLDATLKSLGRNSPLSMACTLDIVRKVRSVSKVRDAIALEFRFTSRSLTDSDFMEGIRAQIIDKDRSPQWRHRLGAVPPQDVAAMLAPLGAKELTFKESSP